MDLREGLPNSRIIFLNPFRFVQSSLSITRLQCMFCLLHSDHLYHITWRYIIYRSDLHQEISSFKVRLKNVVVGGPSKVEHCVEVRKLNFVRGVPYLINSLMKSLCLKCAGFCNMEINSGTVLIIIKPIPIIPIITRYVLTEFSYRRQNKIKYGVAIISEKHKLFT